MNSIVEFLNHGVMPFVGREKQVDSLLRFWRETLDAHGLRVMLLQGEAGIGKSRLLEEILREVRAEHGVVVHLKVYPDTSSSLVSLIASALDENKTFSLRSREGFESTTIKVIHSLRTISRLRATLLVLEDLHALDSQGLGEFSQILHALVDENLSIICSARTAEIPMWGTLEPYITDEISLQGLSKEGLEALWKSLLGVSIGASLRDLLYEKTLGSPLSINSILRGILRPIVSTTESDQEHPSMHIDNALIQERLHQGAERYRNELIAHLTPEESAQAGQLSLLGEVFSFEAALALFGEETESVLERFYYKGLLTRTIVGENHITGEPSKYTPITFAHSLTYQSLLGTSPGVNLFNSG